MKNKPEPQPNAEPKIFRLSKWKGLDNYECLFCKFATTDPEIALRHYEENHKPKPEPKPASPILIADKNGKPIN